MRFKRLIMTVDAHVQGGPVRAVIGGIPNIPGKTMAEKQDFAKLHIDNLRTALLCEPRGHRDMFACILTAPVTDEADFGALFLGSGAPTGYVSMCGHGSLGVATIAVETGIVEAREPITEIIIDTLAGSIHVRVNVKDGRAESATIQNVPAFLYKTELIEVPNLGQLPVDIVYGGNYYALVEAKHLGFEINAANIWRSEDLFAQIMESVNRQVEIRHPEIDSIKGVIGVLISDRSIDPKANIRNILVAGGGHIDRSPCGTGTCARMAAAHAKGELSLEETFVTESLLGTFFYGKLVKEVNVSGIRAVVPEVSGRGFITGIHNFVIDEEDPLKYGFKL